MTMTDPIADMLTRIRNAVALGTTSSTSRLESESRDRGRARRGLRRDYEAFEEAAPLRRIH
jgi:hypothetical protein